MSLTQSTITDEQFVKLRCGTDQQTYYFVAIGAMYAQPLDSDQPAHLFNFLGVDVSRCILDPDSSHWFLLSRKFSLYLDPQTNQRLRWWHNPWTDEKLNVIHRSYDYQEFQIPKQIEAYRGPETSIVSLDINLKLPNSLAQDPRFQDYSPEPFVQSSDSYKFIFPTQILQADSVDSALNRAVAMSYYRMGPWEPWMKMKGKPGFIVLNYSATKTPDFTELNPELKAQIEKRPLYREAPATRLDRSIGTSWSRFEEEFDAYLAGEEFPLPAD